MLVQRAGSVDPNGQWKELPVFLVTCSLGHLYECLGEPYYDGKCGRRSWEGSRCLGERKVPSDHMLSVWRLGGWTAIRHLSLGR